MLPTTGHFKNISCPFYDSCICERPYCHFKHTKREPVNDTNLISELVSKAVHKVLNSNTSSPSEGNEKVPAAGDGKPVTYNPTPISELNKIKSSSTTKDLPEKRNRHIPIQYTPEQPRSFRSATLSCYSNSLEFRDDDSKTAGYEIKPKLGNQSSVSYIPSSIKTLADQSSEPSTDTKSSTALSATNSHQYVPFNIKPEDSQLTAEYNPTKNLSLDNISLNEYVPKYTDEFIDDFINDPSIYEPTEIKSDKISKTDDKLESSETLQTKSTTEKSDPNSEKHAKQVDRVKSSTNKEKSETKKRPEKDSDKDKKKKHKKSSDSDTSSHSRSSSKSTKHKSEKKDCEKDEKQHNGYDKVHKQEKEHNRDKDKLKDKKHKSRRERSRSRSRKKSRERTRSRSKNKGRSESKDKREKSVHNSSSDKRDKISVNSNKLSENVTVTNSDFKEESDDDSIHSVFLDYPEEISESDDELEQCKRIFEEYQPPTESVQVKTHPKPEPKGNEINSAGKKRVAHENSQNIARKAVIKAPSVKSAALIMANRYKQMKANMEEKSISNAQNSEPQDNANHVAQFKRPFNKTEKVSEDSSTDPSYHTPAKIKRIAHVPNVSSLLNAKKKVEEIAKNKQVSKTPIQTVAKGGKRIAHTPEVSVADIPTVLQSEKSKLPVNVRNRYLFLMVKECIKLYVSKQAAYERALNEELNCYSKCSAIATYRNSVMLSINRLRKEAELGLNSINQPAVERESPFMGKTLYGNIIKWTLSEEELLENGFPRPGSSKKGHAVFKENKFSEKVPEGCELCVRCHKIFKVDDFGIQVHKEECIYHPGKRYYYRGETKYICCKESAANSGCCVGSNHVFEIRDPVNLTGFVQTFQPENLDDARCYAVYALDCEMVYTTKGFELARVTVINSNCEVVYETLVKPVGAVIDCNTRYSGITTDMIENTNTRITEVQATLLLMFNSKTILIGHSLESDLKALRMIHDTVIDTSVLYPHKMGPPRKRGLRTLASEYLNKIIQNDEGGHDSAEDAITCMELIMYKLKEEIKLR